MNMICKKMLFHTNDSCKKWRMSINQKKTNVVHFRSPLTRISNYQFCFGEKKINYVNSYKYLGFYVDEHMNFVHGSTVLSESAGRALGGVIGKRCWFPYPYNTLSGLCLPST